MRVSVFVVQIAMELGCKQVFNEGVQKCMK